MTTLDDRLAAYDSLSPQERAEVAREVAASRPDLAPRLAEARAFAALIDAAQGGGHDPVADALVDARLGLRDTPVVADTPEDAARAAQIRENLDRLDAEAESPAAMFARLTGRPVDFGSEAEPTTSRTAQDRAAAAPARSARTQRAGVFRRVLVSLGLLVVALYGGLALTQSTFAPERSRVAELGDVAASYQPITVRGAAADPFAERYEAALAMLGDARRTTLGLFPRYDDAELDRAAAAFAAIAGDADPASRWAQEATLALGRIRLLQGRDDDARRALASVPDGYRASDARRLLDWLDTQPTP